MPDVVATAWLTSRSAAEDAGVVVRAIDSAAEAARAADLFQAVWRAEQPPASAALLRVVGHTGGYVSGAYDSVRGELLAASVGLLSAEGLHSHITGVLPSGQGRGLGRALKHHQRAWALDRGISTITWTSDPLVRRNNQFNLQALGAEVDGYLVDFYGPMTDAVNRGDETDRFHWSWELAGDTACAAAAGQRRFLDREGTALLVSRDAEGGPVAVSVPGRAVRVALPEDIEQLRAHRPDLAVAWRAAVRQAVHPLLAEGARIRGLTAAGELVLELSP